ncbi:DUF6250 domain-containing protein [Duganella sp. BuS-21]|uniref:DUF6250 domain-containing protein n=1 Tax=Duganella sp. BuS-21 TaxID=2943848 RepID=UPI0035A68BFC
MSTASLTSSARAVPRCRYYDGSGQRRLLQEYTAPAYLLQVNRPYRIRIRIVVDARGTRLYVDENEYFSAPGPLAGGGYFCSRTTQSRHKVEHLSVRQVA